MLLICFHNITNLHSTASLPEINNTMFYGLLFSQSSRKCKQEHFHS